MANIARCPVHAAWSVGRFCMNRPAPIFAAPLLNVETDRAHELQSVASLNDSRTQPVVETQFAVFEMIFEVEICGGGSHGNSNFGQGEIVRGKQSDGAALEEVPHHSFRADATVVRVCSL